MKKWAALLIVIPFMIPGFSTAAGTYPDVFDRISPDCQAGRYVMVQSRILGLQQYLVDTQSGRTWQLLVDKSGIGFFKPVPFEIQDEKDLYEPTYPAPDVIPKAREKVWWEKAFK